MSDATSKHTHTRRKFIAAIAVTPLAGVVTAKEFETPISSLFRKWKMVRDGQYSLVTDEELTDVLNEMRVIEKRISAFSPTCLSDLAIKITTDTHYGDFDLTCEGGKLILNEAGALADKAVA